MAHDKIEDSVLPPPNALVVDGDDSYREVAQVILERDGWNVRVCHRGDEALRQLRQAPVDVLILDYLLTGARIGDVLREVRNSPRTTRLPVMVVTSVIQSEIEVRVLEMGADAFVTKPYETKILLAHARALLRMKRLNDETENFENVLSSLIAAVEAKDPYTRGHSVRVSNIGSGIARAMGMDEKSVLLLKRAGLLHDVGKLVVDLSFINKPGKLDDAEWAVMKTHPEAGARICAPLRSALPILPLVRAHHERLNGTGYPDGLVEDQIPIPVRIISVADVYDALTTDRAYRKAMTHRQAMGILEKEAEKGSWDADVVKFLGELGPDRTETA